LLGAFAQTGDDHAMSAVNAVKVADSYDGFLRGERGEFGE
jgi:hypothetical protein